MWDNPDLVLYHGTTQEAAESIRREGIRFGPDGARDLDFGRGFYTTTNLAQARDWARRRCRRTPHWPYLVKYVVPRQELATAKFMAFVRGDARAADYWQLVEHCRSGGGQIPPVDDASDWGWYDVVIGPVAVSEGREVHAAYDQVSVHAEHGKRILDQHLVELIRVDGWRVLRSAP
ncbi:MAG: DUF3990 domain-containing protein [Armatimonadetes bacterium]|nr:DUF3990 domain-containing protein [Armatimonadota bacterium]